MKSIFILIFIFVFGVLAQSAIASNSDAKCPVGLVNGLTLDEEFGPGTSEITRCISKREKVKVIYQVNTECKNSACTKPYAIGNMNNAIKDFEITHGMSPDDYDMVAIVHSGGWPLVLNNDSVNPHARINLFQAQMEALIAKGVTVLFCQNTARSKGVKTDQLIPGIGYTTAGVTAISDYQALGYSYVQP